VVGPVQDEAGSPAARLAEGAAPLREVLGELLDEIGDRAAGVQGWGMHGRTDPITLL
jgi:hypothetical protein